jgi:hypothetical protein
MDLNGIDVAVEGLSVLVSAQETEAVVVLRQDIIPGVSTVVGTYKIRVEGVHPTPDNAVLLGKIAGKLEAIP